MPQFKWQCAANFRTGHSEFLNSAAKLIVSMELSHLRALIAVSESGNFGRAGQALHLSPPAVFDQVRQLEGNVGAKLYERSGRRLVLTEAGNLIHTYAQRILREHDEALQAVGELAGLRRGRLSFGCGPHISVSVVPHLLRAFLARYPNVEVRLVTGNDHVLFDDLQSGKVDVLLMNLPVTAPHLTAVPLWRAEMVFIVPPSDVPASVDLVQDLARRPFIFYQRAVVIEEAIRRFCVEVGFEPKVVMHNDQADSIKELVKLGMGASLLPLWSVSEDVQRGALRLIRLPDRRLFTETGLIYRKSAHPSAALRELCSVALDWANWLPRSGDVSPI